MRILKRPSNLIQNSIIDRRMDEGIVDWNVGQDLTPVDLRVGVVGSFLPSSQRMVYSMVDASVTVFCCSLAVAPMLG